MAIDLKKILKGKKFSQEELASINEAINAELNTEVGTRLEELEKENSAKFESLVNGIEKKFDEKVNTAVLENVNEKIGKSINSKFYNLIKDMVGLLENAGIPTTEKTKELQQKLKKKTEDIALHWQEREEMKEQLGDAKKNEFIMGQLQGMSPQIVDAALEHFKNTPMDNVKDDIEDYVVAYKTGDFSNMDTYSDEDTADKEYTDGEIDLKNVEGALNNLQQTKSNDMQKERLKNAAKMEGLSKGIRQDKITATPNVTNESLEDAARRPLLEDTQTNMESDVKGTMDQINHFGDLGYNFRDKSKNS
jgi:hypothetical protein